MEEKVIKRVSLYFNQSNRRDKFIYENLQEDGRPSELIKRLLEGYFKNKSISKELTEEATEKEIVDISGAEGAMDF